VGKTAELAALLRARRAEIEATARERVYAVSDPTAVGDPAYVAGLRTAISAGLDYALAGIEAQSPEPGPIPGELFAQARSAARNGVSLDTVLRRYFAGYALLGDFVIQEAERSELFGFEELKALSKAQGMLFDRLVEATSAEYRRAAEHGPPSPERRRAECVRRLLAGELADSSQLAYELDGWHLGAVASGGEAKAALRALAAAADARLLAVEGGGEAVWGWLGGRQRLDPAALSPLAAEAAASAGACLALGEPGCELAGWRLTHRQAAAAHPVAQRGPRPSVRYADVALLASTSQDEVLAASLRQLYLDPLAEERDGGTSLCRTLRAYFSAGRNASSAAAALGVSRKTVNERLRTAERHIGRPLGACAAGLEAALDLEEMSLAAVPRIVPPGR